MPASLFDYSTAPANLAEAQLRYNQVVYERASLGEIKGRRETKRAGLLDNTKAAILAIFPTFDPTKDYQPANPAAEWTDSDKPATLAEIQTLANSIPIPSLGAQGSSAPPLTTEGASTGIGSRTWLLFGVVGAVVIGAALFLFKK